jgi:hypothetical protein
MGKVNWNAKHDYEYTYNYKILQTAFQKKGIARHVDVSLKSPKGPLAHQTDES